MIENIGPLVSLYKTLTEGIRSINVKARSKEKYKIQRKIISIQIILENIIETAEQIFAILDVPIKENSKLDKNKKDELKNLTNAQKNNLGSSFSKSSKHNVIINNLKNAGYEVIVSIGDLSENEIGSNCGQHVMNFLKNKVKFENSYTVPLQTVIT